MVLETHWTTHFVNAHCIAMKVLFHYKLEFHLTLIMTGAYLGTCQQIHPCPGNELASKTYVSICENKVWQESGVERCAEVGCAEGDEMEKEGREGGEGEGEREGGGRGGGGREGEGEGRGKGEKGGGRGREGER